LPGLIRRSLIGIPVAVGSRESAPWQSGIVDSAPERTAAWSSERSELHEGVIWCCRHARRLWAELLDRADHLLTQARLTILD
jgi:hypothetical protein